MSAIWVSKIGVPNADGSQPPAMTAPQRATPLGGTLSDSDIDSPTTDDAADGLAAYGYRDVYARFQVTGGTNAAFQVWGWNDWFGYWFKIGSPVTVLADATAAVTLASCGVDRIMAQATGSGAPTSVLVQFAGYTPGCEGI